MSRLWTLFYPTLLILLTPPALGAKNPRNCRRDQHSPTISPSEWDPQTARRNPEYRLVIIGNPILAGTYRNDITVLCSSSDASNLTIEDISDPRQPQALMSDRLNSTTIQVLLKNPDVGDFGYLCIDSRTNCTDALYIQVKPAMAVLAPRVQHTLNHYGITLYFVARGETYNVFCSAQKIADVNIDWKDNVLETMPYNATTIVANVTDHIKGERLYHCGNWDYPLAEIYVLVDYYPEAREFQCVLYKKVECSWKSSNKGNTFRLFVLLMYDKISRLICIDRSGSLSGGCADVFDDESRSLLLYYKSISFELETCNTVFCSNQTFAVNVRASTKLDPVYDLKLTKVSSQSATVTWHQKVINFYSTYKVDYRLLGTEWIPVNVSAVQCEYTDVCGIQLQLPCPDTHYELRVYIRDKQATSDVYWSEPASTYFFTASSSGEVDLACGADFRDVTEEPPLSAAVVLYKVRALISDERKEKKALKAKVNALKEKLASVEALMG